MYPVILLGRIIATILSMLGIGIFAIPSGLIGASFIDEIREEREFKLKEKIESTVD